MITIDQLLESMDLDFEPRWVTKDMNGTISIFAEHPQCLSSIWASHRQLQNLGKIKLAEFEGKDWTDCIYEVPRKMTEKIERFTDEDFEVVPNVYGANEKVMGASSLSKLNLLVDAVNELKGAKND